MGKKFTITIETKKEYEEGFGVVFEPIPHKDSYSYIEGFNSEVIPINQDSVKLIGLITWIKGSSDKFYPLDNFNNYLHSHHDCNHDLTLRFFSTEEEAKAHIDYTNNRWINDKNMSVVLR